jgi:hypothetical protein
MWFSRCLAQIFGEISFLEGGKTTAAVIAEHGSLSMSMTDCD